MENLKDILEKVAKEAGWGKKWDRAKIWDKWCEIIPTEIAKLTKPLRLSQKDVLYVGVENNYVMQELNFQKRALLERVNSILQPENRIKDIKFVLDFPGDPVQISEDQPETQEDIEIDPKVLERIRGIEDTDLRESLLSFYRTSKKRRKIKPES